MSLVQELYTIFDKERARYQAVQRSKHAVIREIADNLALLREGLRNEMDSKALVSKLDTHQFNAACDNGFNFNQINKQPLKAATFGHIKEFSRYQGKSSQQLIELLYQRIKVAQKLGTTPRALKYLFKFHMLVLAHCEDNRLRIRSK